MVLEVRLMDVWLHERSPAKQLLKATADTVVAHCDLRITGQQQGLRPIAALAPQHGGLLEYLPADFFRVLGRDFEVDAGGQTLAFVMRVDADRG
jgi:hypothetical protein